MLDMDNTSSHRLVGKFFTNSTPPFFEETEQSLREQWSISNDDMTVQKQDQDKFLFEFKQQKDKEEVITKGPFYVNGVIIVIKDPDSSDDDMIDFTFVRFPITMVGIPTFLCNKISLPVLESLMGDNCPVLVTDCEEHGLEFCDREVDLKKPLNPGFYIAEHQFVQFKYENLGDFCYSCGMLGHKIGSNDKCMFPKERDLNSTSRTNVYGPWLRYYPWETSYEFFLEKSVPDEIQNRVLEYEKTLSYAQFFVEIEFNNFLVCNPNSSYVPKSTHKFRFPCSYLDTTSKAHEVIQREIDENKPFSFCEFEDKPKVIILLVERLKLIYKNEFSSEDKWLNLKLQVNEICKLKPVDYETLTSVGCWNKAKLTESKILDLIKKRVEEKDQNLLCLSTWEDKIKEVISEVGCDHYTHLLDVSRRANHAMEEAVQMEISSTSCPIPADKDTISKFKRFNVRGSDMDRLDPCMICAGEMFLGEEATVMPCSHVFHSSCIEEWLQVGHKCPLCCYELPSRKRKRTI